MKQLLILIAMISLMSCALVPDQRKGTNKKPKRSELIRSCVYELSDSHGLKEATESCLKIYSRIDLMGK